MTRRSELVLAGRALDPDRDLHRRPEPARLPDPGRRDRLGCRDGDVFVSGTLRGRLTIAAENNITIVANTTYQTTGAASTDMLGAGGQPVRAGLPPGQQ